VIPLDLELDAITDVAMAEHDVAGAVVVDVLDGVVRDRKTVDRGDHIARLEVAVRRASKSTSTTTLRSRSG
jgi:hypothetical protein